MTRPVFFTVGHGTLSQAAFGELLHGAGITDLVDVRRFPGSRRFPHVNRAVLERWLPAEGIGYRWDERLGGRRRLPADSPDVWWRTAAFRAYAHHMRTAEFIDAMAALLDQLGQTRTTLMCSESLWWRCHRRLIADHATLVHAASVRHLGHTGRLTDHPIAAGARLLSPETIIYDRDETPVVQAADQTAGQQGFTEVV